MQVEPRRADLGGEVACFIERGAGVQRLVEAEQSLRMTERALRRMIKEPGLE